MSRVGSEFDLVKHALGNMYASYQLQDKAHWSELATFLNYAKKRQVQVSESEVEHARKNFYNILFDASFRVMQRMMYDRKSQLQLHNIVDLTSGELNSNLEADDQTHQIKEIMKSFMQRNPRTSIPLLPLFYQLDQKFSQYGEDELPPAIQATWDFYVTCVHNLEQRFPAMLKNVVHIFQHEEQLWHDRLERKSEQRYREPLRSRESDESQSLKAFI
jgi:hypothetical protein